MARAEPAASLKPGRWDDLPLYSSDGFQVEAIDVGWALLSDPDTGEAWIVEDVVLWDQDGDEIDKDQWRECGGAWGGPKGH